MIQLPNNKFIAWSREVKAFLNPEEEGFKITAAALDNLIGCLNHAAYIIPMARHFLNKLRRKKNSVIRFHRNQTLRLSKEEKIDLELWLSFLQSARNGISLNNLTYQNPSQVGISNLSPFGLGGFS